MAPFLRQREETRGTPVTISDVMAALDRIAPPELAEPWDNVGLLLGDPSAPCTRVLVALEADLALLRRAAAAKAQLIISHHPALFRPLRAVTSGEPVGALLLAAARQPVALAAAHTNYDAAPGGVSDVLAGLLDLRSTEPLAPAERGALAKIVVFTPAGDLDAVLRALGESGAGVIGQYRECTFRAPGTGTFRPLADARPTVGRAGRPSAGSGRPRAWSRGRREEIAEFRLEAVVPLALAQRAAQAVRAAHSYEEPAIDVYPLAGGRAGVGIGRCGRLPRATRADRLVRRIKQRLAVRRVRVAGDLRRRVERVAVCGGSGGRGIEDAVRQGCQLYLTGDVSHHQAIAAAAAGLVVVDAGHAPTEAPAIPVLARRLADLCRGVRFTAVGTSPGPFRTV